MTSVPSPRAFDRRRSATTHEAGGFRAERCQFEQSVRRWPSAVASLRAAAIVARRTWWARRTPRGLGPASAYSAGSAVRVRNQAAVASTLDEGGMCRGLLFTDSQWAFCEQTMVVDRVVRQMLDDHGVMRPVSRAVTLAGAHCDAGGAGCGRSCALLFKDEWLEPAPLDADMVLPGRGWDSPSGPGRVRIRSGDEIRRAAATRGRPDRLRPPLDVDRYQGHVFPGARAVTMPSRLAGGIPAPPVGDWFVVDGTRCNGRELANPEPCDRRCALVWHRSWLDFLPEP